MAEPVDILFINPGDRKQTYQALGDEFSAVEPPVFAGLFATHARNAGLSVAVLDAPAFEISAEECARRTVEDYRPGLVVLVVYGFQPSASTQNMTVAGDIARRIKARDPSLPVVMTGTHPAALPERTMAEEAVDFVCDGEGPTTLTPLAQALKAQANDLSAIPSLWRREDGRIVPPAARAPLIADLDAELPGIAWDLLPMDRYRAHNWHCFDHIEERLPYAAIHTSLGCPYHCGFCCINAPFGKSSYRMWSPEAVVAEIDRLVTDYGVKNLKIVDEMFVLNRRHVLGICDLLIERDYDLNIWAYARVDTVKDAFLEKLRKAGVRWLALGIESASKHVRDGADKVYTDDDIKDVVRRIHDAGIYVIGNYIFGLPDDTRDSMQATLDLAHDLNCEFANFYSAMAYPGSALYAEAQVKGWPLPESWKDFSQHGYGCLPLPTDTLTSAEVLAFRDRAFDSYYADPRYLAMIEETFGPAVVAHIGRMAAMTLKRKILGD